MKQSFKTDRCAAILDDKPPVDRRCEPSECCGAGSAIPDASTLLSTLLENSPDAIYFKDRQSRFVHYSKSFLAFLRLDECCSLQGKTDADIFGAEHARQTIEDEQEIIRTGNPIVGKLEKEMHRDGRVTWAMTNKMPWRNEDGDIIGIFGISKDVTALKEAEQEQARGRRLLRTLLDPQQA